jgi:hypothetical protein
MRRKSSNEYVQTQTTRMGSAYPHSDTEWWKSVSVDVPETAKLIPFRPTRAEKSAAVGRTARDGFLEALA